MSEINDCKNEVVEIEEIKELEGRLELLPDGKEGVVYGDLDRFK